MSEIEESSRGATPGTVIPRLERFVLKGDLSAGGHATGKKLLYIDGELVESSRDYEFYDALGDLTGSSGSKGYSWYCPDAKRHEIITLTC